MPQHDSRQSEQDGRPVGEVTEHERVRDAAVLVHDDEVRHLVRAARVGQFGHDVVTAVDSGRIRDAEAQFLVVSVESLLGFGCAGKWRGMKGMRYSQGQHLDPAQIAHTHSIRPCVSQGCANRNALLQTVGVSTTGLARW